MNTETDYLKSIAEEIAANHNKDQIITKANHHLAAETKRLEKEIINNLSAISNFTQRDTFYFNTLSKLVNICDILFDITGTVNPDVIILIDLLTAVKQIIPEEIRPSLKLPKAFIMMQKELISISWIHFHKILDEHEVDKKLIEIASIPFARFVDVKEKLYWGDFTWLKGYQSKLQVIDWENADCSSKTEALMSLLIGRDFNHDRFYIYCKKYIESRTKAIRGKRNRLLEYALCEKLVLEDTQIGMSCFDVRANTVSTRLLKWIKEEIDFVETHEKEHSFAKLHFNMANYKIAFFFKLLSEQKVFGDTPFKELANQIASTCLSLGGEEIQAKTIISKAYPNDQKTFVEMEKLLENMLNYVRRFISVK